MKLPIEKINFGTLCAAVLLFFLPWTNLDCNGKLAATQSGVQAITAGYSLSDDAKQAQSQSGASDTDSDSSSQNDKPGHSLIILLAFLVILGGATVSGLILFKHMTLPVKTGAVATAALVLILFEVLIGFPIDNSASKANADANKNVDGSQNAFAASVSVTTSRTGWFYLELLALAVPTGFFVKEIVDCQMKAKASASAPPPTTPPVA